MQIIRIHLIQCQNRVKVHCVVRPLAQEIWTVEEDWKVFVVLKKTTSLVGPWSVNKLSSQAYVIAISNFSNCNFSLSLILRFFLHSFS